MIPSIPRSTDLVLQQEIRSTMDVSKPEPSHGPDAPLAMPFYPQGANSIIPPNVRKDLKKDHDTIFNPTAIPPPIPTRTRKPLYLLKRIIRDPSSMLKRMLSTPHTENFQRKVHVEIDVPGTGVTSTTVDVFFDIYSPFNHIAEDFATRFGIVPKSDAVHLIKHVRWHAEEDNSLREPRLHFNDLKYEEGEFRYVKHLSKFGLVIGWNTIQALKLLELKDDIAAAGEGFRQLPPSVDKNVARRNQSAVADARVQEWELMKQHAERQQRKRDAVAAAAAARN